MEHVYKGNKNEDKKREKKRMKKGRKTKEPGMVGDCQ
jgi:hypothetical protein